MHNGNLKFHYDTYVSDFENNNRYLLNVPVDPDRRCTKGVYESKNHNGVCEEDLRIKDQTV